MTDREGLLVRAAALTYLGEQVAKAQAAVRGELMAVLKPGERAIAALADGTEVGTVTIGRPPVTASVVDEHAFLRWVRDNHPDEIVDTVRSSFRTQVIAESKIAGQPCTAHGEVVNGVAVRDGSPSYRPGYNRDQLPTFIDAIRASYDLMIGTAGEIE